MERKKVVEDSIKGYLYLTEWAIGNVRLGLSIELKTRRNALGLSQKEIGRRIQSSQSRIAKAEKADPSISLELLIRALVATGIEPDNIAITLAEAMRKFDSYIERVDAPTVHRQNDDFPLSTMPETTPIIPANRLHAAQQYPARATFIVLSQKGTANDVLRDLRDSFKMPPFRYLITTNNTNDVLYDEFELYIYLSAIPNNEMSRIARLLLRISTHIYRVEFAAPQGA